MAAIIGRDPTEGTIWLWEPHVVTGSGPQRVATENPPDDWTPPPLLGFTTPPPPPDPLSPTDRAKREQLRAADDLHPYPGSNCARGAHPLCRFRVDCPCPCHDGHTPDTPLPWPRPDVEPLRWEGDDT